MSNWPNARQLHDITSRHHADHGIATVPPRFERRLDRLDLIVNEQHGGEHDVAGGDIVLAGFHASGLSPIPTVACSLMETPGISRSSIFWARSTAPDK
jgi:hypothetical protein